MPWLDAVGRETSVDNKKVHQFDFAVDKGRILVIDYSQMDDLSYALLLSYVLSICKEKRDKRMGVGIVQMVDEAHRIFDNESRHSDTLAQFVQTVLCVKDELLIIQLF